MGSTDMKYRAIFLSAAIILLVVTAAFFYFMTHPREFQFGAVLSAERLSAKPADYFTVTDPDPYFLEAVSHPGTLVFAGFWEDITIDERIAANNTNNVEYSGVYYTIQLGSADPAFGGFILMLLLGWIGLALSFAITTLRQRTRTT
jgi:hypothetical protein